jgi:hypothetical protein
VSNTDQESYISEKFPDENDETKEMYIYYQALEIYINIKNKTP